MYELGCFLFIRRLGMILSHIFLISQKNALNLMIKEFVIYLLIESFLLRYSLYLFKKKLDKINCNKPAIIDFFSAKLSQGLCDLFGIELLDWCMLKLICLFYYKHEETV